MKRLRIIVLIIACLMTAVVTQLSVSAYSYVRGDADGDGEVMILDATAIQRKLAELSVSSFNEKAADVDGDGLNIIDATMIQRYLAEFPNTHSIEEVITEPDPTIPPPTHDQYELPLV